MRLGKNRENLGIMAEVDQIIGERSRAIGGDNHSLNLYLEARLIISLPDLRRLK